MVESRLYVMWIILVSFLSSMLGIYLLIVLLISWAVAHVQENIMELPSMAMLVVVCLFLNIYEKLPYARQFFFSNQKISN